MLKDILAQAWEAMVYNRRRTAITMIGMAWGIATVVLLLAYGAGFSRAIVNIFAQWGVNHMEVYGGRTSEQAGADKAGVRVQLTQDDADRIWNSVPGITSISPVMFVDSAVVQNDLHTYTLVGQRSAPGRPRYSCPRPDRGPPLQRTRRAAARPRLRHRQRCQDQTLLRWLRNRRNHPPQRDHVHRYRRPARQDGRRPEQHQHLSLDPLLNRRRSQGHHLPGWHLVQLSRRQRGRRAKSPQHARRSPSLSPFRPSRHLRSQPAEPAPPVPHRLHRSPGPALDWSAPSPSVSRASD